MDSLNTVFSRSRLAARGNDASESLTPTMVDLLIALMVLILVSLLLVGTLYVVRKIRRSRQAAHQTLTQYNEPSKSRSNHRRLTITAMPMSGRNSSIYVYDEKSSMLSGSSSAPLSPENIPEIHITFPDEHDEGGRPKSGRVVVVRVGEQGNIGLEPVKDEPLPKYEKDTGGRFQSLDLERMGGLKEKEEWS